MKTKLIETKFKCAIGRTRQLFSRIACLGVVILICGSASAQNLFVSGSDARGGEIFKFTWDGVQSIFASGLTDPGDLAFDRAGNLFVVDNDSSGKRGEAAVYKITPNGVRTTVASGLSYPASLAVDQAGNLFATDYDRGIIYEYNPIGKRATFASGLHHPVGLAFNSAGTLFVADNSIGNIYQGRIYEYKSSGSRGIFAMLEPSDRPADLAFDSMGNLLMADLGGNIYKYNLNGVLRRHIRTTFGSVPNSAQSLACDSAGNLFVVDSGLSDKPEQGVVTNIAKFPSVIYEFAPNGNRRTFAKREPANDLSLEYAYLALQPISTTPTATETAMPTVAPRQPTPTPRPRPTPVSSPPGNAYGNSESDRDAYRGPGTTNPDAASASDAVSSPPGNAYGNSESDRDAYRGPGTTNPGAPAASDAVSSPPGNAYGNSESNRDAYRGPGTTDSDAPAASHTVSRGLSRLRGLIRQISRHAFRAWRLFCPS